MEFLVVVILFVGFGFIVWGLVAFVRAVLSWSPPSTTMVHRGDYGDTIDGMNEGDLHSGPHGYSPGTAYPETQYGSGFDPDADWNHEDR
jgi:hypothetical protein